MVNEHIILGEAPPREWKVIKGHKRYAAVDLDVGNRHVYGTAYTREGALALIHDLEARDERRTDYIHYLLIASIVGGLLFAYWVV